MARLKTGVKINFLYFKTALGLPYLAASRAFTQSRKRQTCELQTSFGCVEHIILLACFFTL